MLQFLAQPLGKLHLSGGDVGKADAKSILCQIEGTQKVIFSFGQHRAFDDGARGGDPDNFSLNYAFGLIRRLHLLTDGDLVALFHQLLDIGIAGMIGHATHGRPLRQAAVPASESQLQLPGSQNGIIKKHFIKIAQTIKQYVILMHPFDFLVLLHHGREFFQGFRSPFPSRG